MKGLYFYRNQMIERTPNNKGWFYFSNDIEMNIYKTLEDVKNAIDKRDGFNAESKNGLLQRNDKPIRIIGKMKFILDSIDKDGKVTSHYECEWY